MKVEDLRKQTKPCYIHNLHVGDTFLYEGQLYYVYICNHSQQSIGAINLITNSIHLFDIHSPQTVTPVKCKVCILEDEQY